MLFYSVMYAYIVAQKFTDFNSFLKINLFFKTHKIELRKIKEPEANDSSIDYENCFGYLFLINQTNYGISVRRERRRSGVLRVLLPADVLRRRCSGIIFFATSILSETPSYGNILFFAPETTKSALGGSDKTAKNPHFEIVRNIGNVIAGAMLHSTY